MQNDALESWRGGGVPVVWPARSKEPKPVPYEPSVISTMPVIPGLGAVSAGHQPAIPTVSERQHAAQSMPQDTQQKEIERIVHANNMLVKQIMLLEREASEERVKTQNLYKQIQLLEDARVQDNARFNEKMNLTIEKINEGHIEQAKKARNIVQDAINALKQQLNDKNEEISRLSEELDDVMAMQKKIRDLMDRIQQAEKFIHDLQNKVKELELQKSQLMASLQSEKDREAALEAQLSNSGAQIAALQEELRKRSMGESELADEIKRLQEELKARMDDLVAERQIMTRMEKEKIQEKRDRDIQEERLCALSKSLTNAIREQDVELGNRDQRIADLESQLANARTRIQTLETHKRETYNEIKVQSALATQYGNMVPIDGIDLILKNLQYLPGSKDVEIDYAMDPQGVFRATATWKATGLTSTCVIGSDRHTGKVVIKGENYKRDKKAPKQPDIDFEPLAEKSGQRFAFDRFIIGVKLLEGLQPAT